MNTGKTLFAQIMDLLPWTTFARCVRRRAGDRGGGDLRDGSRLRRFRAFTRATSGRGVLPFFITQAKTNRAFHRVYSATTDRRTGIICDQTIALNGFYTKQDYPAQLRRVRFKDSESGKAQIWIAMSVYVLVAIVKKKLQLDASPYSLLQILSVTLFEKIPLQQAFPATEHILPEGLPYNQLNLFII